MEHTHTCWGLIAQTSHIFRDAIEVKWPGVLGNILWLELVLGVRLVFLPVLSLLTIFWEASLQLPCFAYNGVYLLRLVQASPSRTDGFCEEKSFHSAYSCEQKSSQRKL